MKKILLPIFLAGILLVSAVFYYRQNKNAVEDAGNADFETAEEAANANPEQKTGQDGNAAENRMGAEILAQNLDIPWETAQFADGSFLITERQGNLMRVSSETKEKIHISGVAHTGEGGLLGMALDPDFDSNGYLYIYLTTAQDSGLSNRVERYILNLESNMLSDKTEIITGIPGAIYHDGGRIAFGPDEKLYIATGDAGLESNSQNLDSLAGKILRINSDGGIPEDNPFSSPVFSYGHRNVQGITWDDQGRLWATEHGRSGAMSGYDELNLIKKGVNYGWPEIQGSETRAGMEAPVVHSGPSTTWAPSGAAHFEGSIFFAGLRGQALYEYNIVENKLTEHFKGEFGRLRNVSVGKDGSLFILTNNTDGRGVPKPDDDKIIKLKLADRGNSEKVSEPIKSEDGFASPMDKAPERITKKTFGMFITPENSPVKPDNFHGFHTGVDWEIFPEELEKDVPVRAMCSGTLKLKKSVFGYGGVAIEECEVLGEPATVIYGHLDLGSIKTAVGGEIKAGEVIGILGEHKSVETDGARKHLHLAIHRGKSIELKGYIDSQNQLSSWIDPCLFAFCKA